MVRTIENLWKRFCNENIVGKYIYVNVAVYLTMALIGVVATLFDALNPVNEIFRWVELPADVMQLLCRPWSIVTYMFVHGSFTHILWNMFALYGFGRIFQEFYSTRHFVGIYFLGGIAGGLFFVAAYNIFPHFENVVQHSYLVGASAAVLAIVSAVAVRSPNYVVNLMLLGQMRLKTLAIITVAVSVLLLASENAGGNFAHLGGAMAGWLFAVRLNRGQDITTIINNLGDFALKMFDKLKKMFTRPKRAGMSFTRGGAKHSADHEYNARKKENEAAINHILEKIKKSGYSALSDEEKKRLFDASDK